MRFRSLFSMLFVSLMSSGMLLGAGATWEALITSPYTSVVIPISIPSDTTGTAVSVGTFPQGVAITPDGTKALVANWDSADVTVLDITQQPLLPGYSVPAGIGANAVAITPDGSVALVANFYDNSVSVFDMTKTPIEPVATVSVGNGPNGIAITPDGTKALVGNFYDGTVSVLDIQPSVHLSYSVPVGAGAWFIAVTPDGTKALVSNAQDGTVSVLDLTQSTIGSGYTVSIGYWPTGIAITPDGSKALVASRENTVRVLDLTQPTIGGGYSVPVGSAPMAISVTPDGKRAYVVNSDGQTVSVLDLTQTPIIAAHDPIPLSVSGFGIATTPDQAPTSLFTASVSGLTVTFDGSGSSSPVGNVKEYIWNFGDGSDPVTTTGPAVSHSYVRSGEYSVSLTVVNDAGTSTEVTFTGQTISNHGLPRAQSTQTITLDPLAPPSFRGKVHLDKHNYKILLETYWKPSADMNTWRYEIFANSKKIAVIDANSGDHATIELHPHHFPPRISDKYRVFLDNKYSLRSVNTEGVASALTPLRLKH